MNEKIVYDGFLKIEKGLITQDGKTFERERLKVKPVVAALVYHDERDVYLFTKQYRFGVNEPVVEIVAGLLETGELPEEAIRREVQEELGYEARFVGHLKTIYTSPGISSEVVHIYLCSVNGEPNNAGGLKEEGEAIETVALTTKQILACLKNGSFTDAKTMVAAMHWRRSMWKIGTWP